MRVFISSISELSQNFFNSDPLKFNQYFAITPDYQKYCLAANLPTRFTITLAKEAMLIHDIAIHLLAGVYKLTVGSVKGICAIASGILGLETDHQTSSKQAVIHFGFACIYTVDIFVSITNINKTYPQYLINKIEIFFSDFLKTSNRNVITKNIIVSNPQTEEKLKMVQKELKERDAYLSQLEEELKKTSRNLDNPSQCEKIVDKALESNTDAILTKVRNSTKNNQGEQVFVDWYECPKKILEKALSFEQSSKNIPASSATTSSLSMNEDDLLEQILSSSSSSNEQTSA